MKYYLLFCFSLLTTPLVAQSTDSVKTDKPLKKYESNLFKSLVDTDLVSLSLVSPTLYDNWDKQLKIFKKRYQSQNALLVISKTDSRQKTEFMLEFMKQKTSGKELILAYAEALKVVTVKYLDLDFKYHLHLKEKK